eukprot:TRINITY_DN4620_c5_g1_i1.p1 TRINITY_DN4620_c5_g1~~TRINITY_DN4620_c5_g1_i1.p1  ORF type:complete len:315 (-),score=43.66 TRINITY_DN4620_c5_g1_i1:9-914(-)
MRKAGSRALVGSGRRRPSFSAGGRQSTKKYAGYVKFDSTVPIQSNFGKTPASAAILREEVHRYGSRFKAYYNRTTTTSILGARIPNISAKVLTYIVVPVTAIVTYQGYYKNESNPLAAFNRAVENQMGYGIPRSEKGRVVATGSITSLSEIIRYSSIFVFGSIGWAVFRTRNLFRAFVNSSLGRGLSFEAEEVLERTILTKAAVSSAFYSSVAYAAGCLTLLRSKDQPEKPTPEYVSTTVTLFALWSSYAVFTAVMFQQPFIFFPFLIGTLLLPMGARKEKVRESEDEEHDDLKAPGEVYY